MVAVVVLIVKLVMAAIYVRKCGRCAAPLKYTLRDLAARARVWVGAWVGGWVWWVSVSVGVGVSACARRRACLHSRHDNATNSCACESILPSWTFAPLS
jgi:hypothetical protein